MQGRGFFRYAFEKLHGKPPFLWQERLFEDILRGRIPSFLNVPTACGKTSLVYIWLLALVSGANLPRRLVWIVNRRTVVDQITEEAERIRKHIVETDDGVIQQIRDKLHELSMTSNFPLAVSTLRGELVDNREWVYDPTRPSIIIGTVDMIGSRLLFSGYGDGAWQRPFHAGLLGTDSLIVLDEAHLVPAFQQLLETLKNIRGTPLRPFHVIYLTATHRWYASQQTFQLSREELAEEEISRRVRAKKVLVLKSCPKNNLRRELCKAALQRESLNLRVVIYVWSPEDANEVFEDLSKKATGRVALLTGELRNYERYEQLEKEPYKYFTQNLIPPQTVYLVSTSAGEVGINLYADEAVCDLTPIDSMIQRFGRVNRFGQCRLSKIDLVYEEELKTSQPESKLEQARKKTLEYLERLPDLDGGKDVSPLSFYLNPPPAEAFSPAPEPLFLTKEELFRLAMTSIGISPSEAEELKLPTVDLYLHGEKEEAEVIFAWREDVKYLVELEDENELKRAIRWYPIRAIERLRVNLSRARKYLEKLGNSRQGKVIQILPNGEARRRSLLELKDTRDLAYSTVIFPCEIGGLRNGILDLNSTEKVKDVADEGGKRRRYLVEGTEGRWKIFKLASDEEPKVVSDWRTFIESQFGKDFKMLPIDIKAQDEYRQILVFVVEKREILGFEPIGEQELDVHQEKVSEWIGKIADKLQLDQKLKQNLCLAAKYHDEGKNIEIKGRRLWQEAIGNTDFSRPLAKSGKRHLDYKVLGGYRHELGSCIMHDDLPPLAYYLIATHHGHGRPFFPTKASGPLDREKCDTVNAKLIKYFVELNEKYGLWDLAFLESLLKAADILASEEGL